MLHNTKPYGSHITGKNLNQATKTVSILYYQIGASYMNVQTTNNQNPKLYTSFVKKKKKLTNVFEHINKKYHQFLQY